MASPARCCQPLRSFWAHKRRLTLTIVSIVLGVSFMAATFVLGDTFNRFFDDLFATGGEKVDAQVEGRVTAEVSRVDEWLPAQKPGGKGLALYQVDLAK